MVWHGTLASTADRLAMLLLASLALLAGKVSSLADKTKLPPDLHGLLELLVGRHQSQELAMACTWGHSRPSLSAHATQPPQEQLKLMWTTSTSTGSM